MDETSFTFFIYEEQQLLPLFPRNSYTSKWFLTGFFLFFILGTVRITPQDSRWVGAWWLGFLAAGLISIISSIPFFFLPKTLDKPNKEKKASASSISLPTQNEEKSQMASLTKTGQNVTDTVTGKYFTFIVGLELLIPMKERGDYSKIMSYSNHLKWVFFCTKFGWIILLRFLLNFIRFSEHISAL